MNKQIIEWIFIISLLSVSRVCNCCECQQNVTNIVEQFCRSKFMIKIKVISGEQTSNETNDELNTWYDIELVKFIKLSEGSRSAIESNRIWTSNTECGRKLHKNKRFLISGDLSADETKAITSVCKYGVQNENLSKHDETFFRIKHLQEKCKSYPKN